MPGICSVLGQKGVQKFEKEATDSITKVFLQLKEMDVFEPVFQKDLLLDQVCNGLESLAFMTEEKNGNIKCLLV